MYVPNMKRRIVDILYENKSIAKDENGYFVRYKENSCFKNPDKKNLTKENKTITEYVKNENLMIEDRWLKTPLSHNGKGKVGLTIIFSPDFVDDESCAERRHWSDRTMFESVLYRLVLDNIQPKSDVHVWMEHQIIDGRDRVLIKSMCLI